MVAKQGKVEYIKAALRQRWIRGRINQEVDRLVRICAAHSPTPGSQAADIPGRQPVVLFNASTRLTGISLNAAFSLLLGLGLQLAGIPVVRFACQAGMSRCVLGTDRDHPEKEPPCRACITQSRTLYQDAPTIWFRAPKAGVGSGRSAGTDTAPGERYQALLNALQSLNVEELAAFEWPIALGQFGEKRIPLGALVLPALRWVLRRHHLPQDETTRFLLVAYIQSAYHVAQEFAALLAQIHPAVVVVFNGQFFPEAAARWVSQQMGIPSVSHEVGLLPFTAYFTTGEATAYPLEIPDAFELSAEQNARLDQYLSQRVQGQFSMAGIQFWPEMRGLDESFLERAAQYKQIVPIFTNVIFDTSQPHSNVIFEHMFAWLDLVFEIMPRYPETLFVLRAHPDEHRPGKASRESVRQWVAERQALAQPNLVFFDSDQYISSYQLIQRSKFVMIYNSTIGLEAAILGAPVLCAGRARFTQLPTVFFPTTQSAYRQQMEDFLSVDVVEPLPEFQKNARRFLYYQLFKSSLPFGDYLADEQLWPGFVRLRKFSWQQLTAEHSPAMRVLIREIENLAQAAAVPQNGEHGETAAQRIYSFLLSDEVANEVASSLGGEASNG